jgi:hypothetical protein
MMPLKRGKILPPSPTRKACAKPEYAFFLLDSSGPRLSGRNYP